MDDLDDLFGDTAPLQLPVPVSHGVVSRLNERSLNGCCQKVAWSKTGTIACITANAHGVLLQQYFCDPLDGQWRPSKQQLIENLMAHHGQVDIVHVSWDHTSTILAIVDASGRLSIYMVFVAVNRMNIFRRCTVDPEDDLGSVVGLTWLHVDGFGAPFFYKPTVKKNGHWAFTCTQQNVTGPKPPSKKYGLVIITKGGTAKVIYHDKEARWREIRSEVEHLSNVSGLLTHASMCSDKGNNADSILLATHNIEGELRIYRLQIDFERSALSLQHLCLLTRCVPDAGDDEAAATVLDQMPLDSCLTLLDIVPAGPESKSVAQTSPFVLTAFNSISHDFQGVESLSTTICKWTLRSKKPSLHPSLTQLSSQTTNGTSPSELLIEFQLYKSPSVLVTRALISSQQFNMGTVLAMLYSDGHIEFRDSQSLEPIPPDEKDQISGLAQIGFCFPANGLYVHASLSSNSCAAILIDEQHFQTYSLMQYIDPQGRTALDGDSLSTVNEAFVTQLSIASRAQPSYTDDLMAMIQLFSNQYLNPSTPSDFFPSQGTKSAFDRNVISGIYRVLGVPLDHISSEQPSQSIMGNYLGRCLYVQAALGFQGQGALRPIEGLVAMVLTSLKYLVQALNRVSARRPNTSDIDLKKPEMVAYVLPLTSWLLLLIGFITDELFSIRSACDNSNVSADHIDMNLVNQKIRKVRSPGLLLLLGSTSRSLLRISCNYLRHIGAESDKNRDSSPLSRTFREFDILMLKAPVGVKQFEKTLLQVDHGVRSAYLSAATSEGDRKSAEGQLLFQAEIPQILIEPVKQLLFETVSSLKEQVNEAELYFQDFSSLELKDDNFTKRRNSLSPIDAFTKSKLRKNVKIRRCVRCCSLTEDWATQRSPNPILSVLARSCYCGGSWMLLDTYDVDQAEQTAKVLTMPTL